LRQSVRHHLPKLALDLWASILAQCHGVSPSQAAGCVKVSRLSSAASYAMAVIGPMPGIVMSIAFHRFERLQGVPRIWFSSAGEMPKLS
jgi:hypothetical protein